jgi:RNA polymerase sigma-70 factor, ECF subfamily
VFQVRAEDAMTNGCAPESGRAPGLDPTSLRLVLGQPEQDARRAGRTMEDDRLRTRLAEDVDGTFEDVVRFYQDRLFSFALRVTGNREDAEEVAQDAFVRAYRALCGYPPDRIRGLALRAWLYRITLNVARNRLRGKKARLRTVSLDHSRSEDGDASWEPADDESRRPDAVYESERRRVDMAALVAGLPERYRAPIVLRYVEGLQLDEVARVLDQPLGTTKSHVHRGVNALREALTASRREEVRR